MLKKLKPYIISVLIALGVGGLSALLTMGNMDIYDVIKKPFLAPPGILFPIVWTILYILMGISAAMIYKSCAPREKRQAALYTYGASLAVNFLWSILFFNFGAYLLSFIWLLLLLVLIIKTIFSYHEIKPLAAYLQIPYAAWVAFAGYLNCSIWLMN